MTLKSSLAVWLSEGETLPNGAKSRYTRGQNILGQMLCLLALAVLIPIGMLVIFAATSVLGRESAGALAAHGVKLGILSLF
ncbi:hypothetical protein [Paraburkholderia phytofirmans]|uniref:Uncharacterized protein n=1 Tax=Paraburkholderia phytofirmans (strain DSM 17436 / LMG 22146 / PsJN) TaxID=398527 RepID=B2TH18_PARPJ|nr:hypothetical protein [Paraburkholderia phytofirmans]ACD21567.1 conserved hypothetical protein [Paraburkholderia phytofirmans PsJN]